MVFNLSYNKLVAVCKKKYDYLVAFGKNKYLDQVAITEKKVKLALLTIAAACGYKAWCLFDKNEIAPMLVMGVTAVVIFVESFSEPKKITSLPALLLTMAGLIALDNLVGLMLMSPALTFGLSPCFVQ